MLFFASSTGGFYHRDLHGDALPADAVKITSHRHATLLAAQADGRTIVAGHDGQPLLAPRVSPRLADTRAICIAAAAREARRRILAIASPARQSNDNAAIAVAAYQLGMGGNGSGAGPALARRAAIDAVRLAFAAIEATIAAMTVDELTAFDASASQHWPE